MRVHNYEKYTLVFILSVFLIVVEIMSFICIFSMRVFCYRRISGIVLRKNVILVVVTEEERKILYKNHTVIFNDKKVSYKIEEDRGVLLKKNSKMYYEILIDINTPKDKKYNDVFEFTIQDRKKKILNIIKTMWEGDKNWN